MYNISHPTPLPSRHQATTYSYEVSGTSTSLTSAWTMIVVLGTLIILA
ncbi:hypothetical protein [Dictyobacter aurantiacus]|nr:hypothetical protein [Dictyobacter aurantiacus]